METNTQPKMYLAPMAGVTDAAMRGICARMGAEVTFTEMVSAKALSYRDKKTRMLLEFSPEERRVGVQLFGSDPAILADMAKRVEQEAGERLFVIDINMGCPAPKIVNNGEGCALMKDPALAERIISTVSRAVATPVSVKFRKGWDDNSVNAVEFAKTAEGAGASAVTVHGRTRAQFYGGKADWDIIRAVKEAVGIRVIGNGDIFNARDAADMLAQTGCDAVMVARGVQGNPWLFRQITELLQTGRVETTPTVEERVEMCLNQARQTMQNKGEKLAMLQMRTHAPHYTKGLRYSATLRARLVKVGTYAELEDVLREYLSGADDLIR